MLLAIDTSTAVASLALYAEKASDNQPIGVLAEHTWRAGARQTTEVLPGVRALLAEAGLVPTDLTGIAVALGPGSFNGLRVGLATAKMLAASLDLRIVGIDTLAIAAYQQREFCRGSLGAIRPLYDAGRGQIATALYRNETAVTEISTPGNPSLGGLLVVEQPRIADLDEVIAATAEPTLFCGEIRAEWAERLLAGGEGVIRASAAASLRRAGYLAELAADRLAAGHSDNLAGLQPLYLRRPPVLDRDPDAELLGVTLTSLFESPSRAATSRQQSP